MPKATLTQVLSAYQNNATFQEAWKKNPVQALKLFGFELSAEDETKIDKMLQNSEELDKRISK